MANAIKIYIDQGHNPYGFNTGAEGNGFREQDITYDIGVRLYDLLRTDGSFNPRLSRPTPETILGTDNSSALRVRVDEANAWGASSFLSLHTNSSTNTSATGAECLIYSTALTATRTLAEQILTNLVASTGLRSRGVIARPDLYVLRKTRMPAVLVEMGFISNAQDARLMTSSPDLFARGIYQGLRKYYGVC